MSSKTAIKWQPGLEKAVATVQPALAAWRRQRKPREPIPEALWGDMVKLARYYQPSPVAQALRVNYATLKQRVLASLPATGAIGGDSGKNSYEDQL